MNTRALIAALSLVLVATALSGCSDDDDHYPALNPPQTKSLFETVLDEIRTRTSEITLPKSISDLVFSEEPDSETALPQPVSNN